MLSKFCLKGSMRCWVVMAMHPGLRKYVASRTFLSPSTHALSPPILPRCVLAPSDICLCLCIHTLQSLCLLLWLWQRLSMPVYGCGCSSGLCDVCGYGCGYGCGCGCGCGSGINIMPGTYNLKHDAIQVSRAKTLPTNE